jgi:DNA polymerase I-like protein with 3'-5' exonuclease and polymerase domains
MVGGDSRIQELQNSGTSEIQHHKIPEFKNSEVPKLLLQIHDELIIEAPEAMAEQVAQRCKKIMENIVYLSIPLTVTAEIGDNWGAVH